MPSPRALGIALALTLVLGAAAEDCPTSFVDAIGSASTNTWLFRQGLKLAGAEDKLPNPNALPVTILVPSDKAWLDFFWRNGFLLGQLSSLGSKLTSIMTHHIIPQALTPDQLMSEAKVPTVYGLLTGQEGQLLHYPRVKRNPEDEDQILFMGNRDSEIAGVVEKIQVCNSWVYIVDEVLKPTVDVDDTPDVNLDSLSSLLGGGGGSSETPAAPEAPAAPAPEAAAPAPEAGNGGSPAALPIGGPTCDKTWAQVAGEAQPPLTILKTVLSQAQYAGALPDPARNFTVFAPVDSAFFGLLTTFNLDITKALALGDKLTGVLLFHAAPGAMAPEELAKQTKLTTGLALKANDPKYSLTVGSQGGKTTISGVYPGNTAQILDTFEVCGSRVYVIDKVLVPAESLDAIPAVQGGLDFSAADAAKATPKPAAAAPSPAPAPAAPAPEPAKPSAGAAAAPAAGGATRVSGVALGSGYLAGCTVQLLDKAGTPLKVTATDGEGRFSFDCGADCASLQATLNMPAGQSAACADTLTQQQPAFNVRATVADVKDGAPLALSPLSTISALAAAQQAAPAPEPSTRRLRKMLQLVGEPADVMQQFTVAEAGGGSGAQSASQVSTTEGDALAAAQQGDQAAIRLLAFNQEVICAGSVGGALLAGADASNRTAPAVGAGALLDELAANLLAGKPFNLTDAASLAGLLDSAQSRAAGAGASELKPEAAKAAAGTVALVSGLLEQVVSTAGQGELEGDRAVVVLARLAKVCQTELAPAAEQLARGQLSPAEWEQRYTLQAIGDLAKKA